MDERKHSSGGLPDSLYQGTLDCVHCGLCLSACPTYRVTGQEIASPRGRIYLMRGVAEGRIELGSGLAQESRLCLGCRACETACPAGVGYGALLEATRSVVARERIDWGIFQRIERMVLRQWVPRPRRLHWALTLLRAFQGLKLDRLAARWLPRNLSGALELAPRVPPASSRRRLPSQTPARGERRGCVAFLEGCVMPELFGDVNRASVELLSRQGFEVLVPGAQGCCGALQAHAGDLETAHALASKNASAFDALDVDAIVVNSAGCGAALRECEGWIGAAGERTASRVRDISEFLDEVGLRGPLGRVSLRLAYDDPCHLVHAQGVAEAPRRLLKAIPGIDLVEHAEASACCGAAGTYNLAQPEMARAVLDRKLDHLLAAAPECVATGNPGCLMQIASGLARRGSAIRVLHPVEILLEACRGAPETQR